MSDVITCSQCNNITNYYSKGLCRDYKTDEKGEIITRDGKKIGKCYDWLMYRKRKKAKKEDKFTDKRIKDG